MSTPVCNLYKTIRIRPTSYDAIEIIQEQTGIARTVLIDKAIDFFVKEYKKDKSIIFEGKK